MLSEQQCQEVADTLRGIADGIESGRYRVEDFVLRNGLAQRPPQNGARCYAPTGQHSISLVFREMDVYV